MTKRPLILVAALMATAGLGGCISLFPESKPASLYRITGAVPAVAQTADAPKTTVLRAPTAFTRVAGADQILTTTGTQTAYIAEARWVAPASIMFDEALTAAFTSATPSVRLATRGDIASADRVLRVEVRTFEAQYRSGQDAAPTVVVEARASLSNLRERTAVDDRMFRVERVAADNRVGLIVDAFDGATSQIVGDIARWTQSQPAPAPKPAT